LSVYANGLPGSGKTTLSMQFLLEGVKAGESCLYITLSESKREITKVAASHGWDLSAIHICELIPSEANLSVDAQLTVFNPSELELGETTEAMIAAVNKYKPSRVVIDSLSELRLVAQSPLRYRRQILALKQFFGGRGCTVLMLDDCSGEVGSGQLESTAHDSLNGYLNAMPKEKFLTAQLHELLACLGQLGVVSLLKLTQSGMIGNMRSPVDTTYLADNVILFRFFEARGEVRRAISVVKKRSGKHEKTIRELEVDGDGIHIGEPLSDFQGVLTGVPTYVGKEESLLPKARDNAK
jgi:KaiC/GvpD/RAD55 family RecA-like ATPase